MFESKGNHRLMIHRGLGARTSQKRVSRRLIALHNKRGM